jgi:hypothetical protein
MNEAEARRLEAFGFAAIHVGGGIWVAVRAKEDGRFVVLAAERDCIYGSAAAFWNGEGPLESYRRGAGGGDAPQHGEGQR